MEASQGSLSRTPTEETTSVELLAKEKVKGSVRVDGRSSKAKARDSQRIRWQPSENWRGRPSSGMPSEPMTPEQGGMYRRVRGAMPLVDVPRPEVHQDLQANQSVQRSPTVDIDQARAQTVYGLLPVDPRLLGIEATPRAQVAESAGVADSAWVAESPEAVEFHSSPDVTRDESAQLVPQVGPWLRVLEWFAGGWARFQSQFQAFMARWRKGTAESGLDRSDSSDIGGL